MCEWRIYFDYIFGGWRNFGFVFFLLSTLIVQFFFSRLIGLMELREILRNANNVCVCEIIVFVIPFEGLATLGVKSDANIYKELEMSGGEGDLINICCRHHEEFLISCKWL